MPARKDKLEREGLTVDATERALANFARGNKAAKPKPVTQVKRGLLSSARHDETGITAAWRTVRAQTTAKDDFGELGPRKHEAEKLARENGHQLAPWKKRKGDQYGRQDAWCVDCNCTATVCVEPPLVYKLPMVYGDALRKTCTKVAE